MCIILTASSENSFGDSKNYAHRPRPFRADGRMKVRSLTYSEGPLSTAQITAIHEQCLFDCLAKNFASMLRANLRHKNGSMFVSLIACL